jgi:hypothetical protein
MGKGMTQYLSLKSDKTSKPATQSLAANRWVTVEAGGVRELIATQNSKAGASFIAYLNISTPKVGGASELVLRWVRDPKGINDATGYETKQLKKGATTFIKDVWIFQAKKGQPVILQVKANGKATINTRLLKLAIN